MLFKSMVGALKGNPSKRSDAMFDVVVVAVLLWSTTVAAIHVSQPGNGRSEIIVASHKKKVLSLA